jgi:hypothetical protein
MQRNNLKRQLVLSWQDFQILSTDMNQKALRAYSRRQKKCYESEIKARTVGEYLQGEGSLSLY